MVEKICGKGEFWAFLKKSFTTIEVHVTCTESELHIRGTVCCSWAGFTPFTQPTVSSSNQTNNQPLCILLQFPYRGRPTYNYNCDGPPIRQISESANRNKDRECANVNYTESASAEAQFHSSLVLSSHHVTNC